MRPITKRVLSGLVVLASSLALAAGSSEIATADPGHTVTQPGRIAPTAKKAVVTVVEPYVHPNRPKVTGGLTSTSAVTTAGYGPFVGGTAYKDAHYLGGTVQQMVANYGPCDTAGYKWKLTAFNPSGYPSLLAWQMVSSIRVTRAIGSRCNRVSVQANAGSRRWTTCSTSSTLSTMGDPWNDNTLYYELRYDPACPRL